MRTRAKKNYIPDIKVFSLYHALPALSSTYSGLLMTVIGRERTIQSGRWPPDASPPPPRAPKRKVQRSAPSSSMDNNPTPLLLMTPENPIQSAGGILKDDPIANHPRASAAHHTEAQATYRITAELWDDIDNRVNTYRLRDYPNDYAPMKLGLDPRGVLSKKPRKGERVAKDRWTLWKRRAITRDMVAAGKKGACMTCFVKGRACPECKKVKKQKPRARKLRSASKR